MNDAYFWCLRKFYASIPLVNKRDFSMFGIFGVLEFCIGFTVCLLVFYAADKLASIRKDVLWGSVRSDTDLIPKNSFNLDRIATRKFLNLVWAAVMALSVVAILVPVLLAICIPVAVAILLGFLSANDFNKPLFQLVVLLNGVLMGVTNFFFQAAWM